MSRRIRFRPAPPTPRRSREEVRESITRALEGMTNYNPTSQYVLPEQFQPRENESVYEIGTILPDGHPFTQARTDMEQGRPRRQGLDTLGYLPGRMTEMYGYTGYGRSIHGRSLPSRNEGERVEREQPAHLRFNAEDATFYNPKFYEVDPDQVKNTMDMVKVFRALLGKITLDEETVRKYGLEHYVKEK